MPGQKVGGLILCLPSSREPSRHPTSPAEPSPRFTRRAWISIIWARRPKIREPLARLGDKGYDADDIRCADWSRGTLAMIPTKSTRKVKFTVDHALYCLHNRIERYFNKINNARRFASRYDKLAASFVGFVEINAIRY